MKKILVTGARSGIINHVIDKIIDRYYIYLSVENDKQLEMVKNKYKDYSNVKCFKLDITNTKDREKVANLDIDILICNAAIGEGGSISEIPFDRVRKNYEVNIFSNFELLQLVLKQMIPKKQGKIIMMSSLAAIMPINFLGVYCSTKASISMLTTTLKNELKLLDNNIIIKLIEPGFYHTGFNQVMLENKYDWMNIESYFENQINKIRERETVLISLIEKRNLNSIVNKIVKAIDNDDKKFKYTAPLYQYIAAKIYSLFKV